MRMWFSNISVVRIYLILILILCLYYLQAQWTRQSPLPTGQTVTDACFLNSSTGWIFGLSGTILRTDDGGLSWIDQSSPVYGDISTGLFLDNNIGWIATGDYLNNSGKIFSTKNGGYTWNLKFSDDESTIRDLSFINHDTGWALARCHPPFPLPEQNLFLKTTDGGDNWLVLDSINYSHFIKIDFINNTVGFIAGAGMPNLMKTTDGGISWQASPHVSDASLTDVFFTDANNGYSCGNNFYYTHNGGLSWGYTFCYHSYAVDMYDSFSGWTISIDKVYKVTNGGQNTDYQFTADKSLLTDISALDSAHAFVFGENVSIYSTGDGGINWQEMSNGTQHDLYSVFFLNENDGWAGGSNQTLLRTHDGGKHWAFTRLPLSYPVTDIQFINPDSGRLISGGIYRTVDGGLSWLLSSLPEDPPSDLFFIDFQTGWYLGSEGHLFKSTDGGTVWQEKISGTGKDLRSIYFVDELNGWIAGNGIMMKSVDGGENWESCYEGSMNFMEIGFFSGSVGYALVENPSGRNFMVKTADGGITWEQGPGFPDMNAMAFCFLDQMKGWVAGEGGAIYYTETGGTFGIDDYTNSERDDLVRIYPNPSKNEFTISFHVDSADDFEIGVYDLQGKKVWKYNEISLNTASYMHKWDPGNFPPGIYLCKVRIGEHAQSTKIIYLK
jgi:photosystem II stability/assembly factor-like uncharacterized protein